MTRDLGSPATMQCCASRGHVLRGQLNDSVIPGLPAIRPDWSAIPDLGPNGTAAVGVAVIVMMLMEKHRDWQQKKRVGAVEAVLQVARQPVHRSQVAEALVRLGRTSDSLDHVSAALAHLNREGRAHPVGNGYWASGPAPLGSGGEVRTGE